MTPAALTPGSSEMLDNRASTKRTRAAASGYLDVGIVSFAVVTRSGSKPGSTARSCRKLSTSNAAVTSRATAIPICPTTSACCARRPPGPDPPDRSASQLASLVRITPSAGIAPASTADSTDAVMANIAVRAFTLHVAKAGHRRRAQHRNDADETDRQAEPGDPAGECERKAFGDDLQRQSCTPGAERGADRELAPPAHTACEQQVRNIGAGEEQHKRHRRHEQARRRAARSRSLA